MTNEPKSKRTVIGTGTEIPTSVAVVLVRLIDDAAPADAATARRCNPGVPAVVIRFAYSTGPVDVVKSAGCSAVAYVDHHGYVLPLLVAEYLESSTDSLGRGFTPNVIGGPLTRAVVSAALAGDTIHLAGEVIDKAASGTVLLQSSTLDHQFEVIAAVHRSSTCRAGQLATQYLPGGAGSGSDFGTILVRNSSTSWCELGGPATVTGLTAGTPVTTTVRIAAAGELELSPRAAAAVPGRALPADQIVASVLLMAGYRDDINGSTCDSRQVIPKTWRLVVGSTTLDIANGQAADTRSPGTGGLITCRGRFGAGPVRIATG